jgi:hypothetical protein
MQPEFTEGETTSFPCTTSARIEEAPQVQSVCFRSVPVACAERNVSTATSAKTSHTLTLRRGPQSRIEQGWQEVSRVA